MADKFVKLNDVHQMALDAVGMPETQEVFNQETADFARGAMWGMSWLAIMMQLKAAHYIQKEEQNDETV